MIYFFCKENQHIQHTQTFFKVWEKHGLKQEPTIVLVETKQLIPDKNLFGHKIGHGDTNVIIQLLKRKRRIMSGGPANMNTHTNLTTNNNITGKGLVSNSDDEIGTPQITSPGGEGCESGDELNSDDHGHAHTQDMNDGFQLKIDNMGEYDANIYNEINIGKSRKVTNAMREGWNEKTA